jgi:hypothetical protein
MGSSWKGLGGAQFGGTAGHGEASKGEGKGWELKVRVEGGGSFTGVMYAYHHDRHLVPRSQGMADSV